MQIPLDFKKTNNQKFDDFIVESNTKTIESLRSFADSNAYIFYLWGASGSGKSHLLNAFIEHNQKKNIATVLTQAKDLANRDHLSIIDMFDCICIDNVEHICSNKELEEALFYWINEVKQAQKHLVLASKVSNKSNHWHLNDLRSRLASGQTHQLRSLTRTGVINAFTQQAKEQGIHLDKKVINYLENNCSMNMTFLKQLLNKLDKATLIHKKQVTIPLIKTILQTELVK